MAARVNGEGILLKEYEAEIQRYRVGIEELGEIYDEEQAQSEVLGYLVDQTLLAQAARAQEYSVDEAVLTERYLKLTEEIGGEEALNAWMADNFYTEESFQTAVVRDLAAMWMRDQILSEVANTAEQVHARQILVRDENEAMAVERQLQAGTPFETLALEYDPLTGGDLGWFPRGYLLQLDVEAAAFSLEPGQFSNIISTSYGFHIVQVIERNPDQPLSPDALHHMQRLAVEAWLESRRAQSEIEVLIH